MAAFGTPCLTNSRAVKSCSSVSFGARSYALSDIHGHIDPFHAALQLVDLDRDPAAELVLLGDYVDRGPASREVLETVRDLQQRFPERVTALLGNHDDWFLDWLDGDDDDSFLAVG
ncbi:hypothetical protein HMPREF2757_10390 [Brevibacterium sp. HMSC063G07]|nr:hypothetical protein HMPREF2757_10390 [Brevibacterium sp. HMSC063G07]OFS27883.1 hypothetical protein HMPREF3162_00130 [Brevibacterium sp. HMSC07C04]